MPEPLTALRGAAFRGYVTVREDRPRGMVQLKGDLAGSAMRDALMVVAGASVPEPLRIVSGNAGEVAWMAPDELLVMLPNSSAAGAVQLLREALSGTPHLALDVSDMRAGIRLEGAGLREVLAKVTPVDMAPGAFEPGAFRRTRLAQIAAAVWLSEPGTAHVLCFRSVARYAFDVLAAGAREGGEVGVFQTFRTSPAA